MKAPRHSDCRSGRIAALGIPPMPGATILSRSYRFAPCIERVPPLVPSQTQNGLHGLEQYAGESAGVGTP